MPFVFPKVKSINHSNGETMTWLQSILSKVLGQKNKMAKNPSFPTILDSVKQINITNLKKWGLLTSNRIMSSTLYWDIDGVNTGSISIKVDTIKKPNIELSYKYKDKPINYSLSLV